MRSSFNNSRRPSTPKPTIVPVRVPTPTPPPEPTSWEISSIHNNPQPTGLLQKSMSEASFSLLQQSMRANNLTPSLLPETTEDPRLQVLKVIGEMLDSGNLTESEAGEALALAMRPDETFMLMRSLFQARKSIVSRAEFLRMWLQSQRQPVYPPHTQFPYPFYPYPPQPAPMYHPNAFADERRANQSMRSGVFFNPTSSPSPPTSTRSASPAVGSVGKHVDLFFAPLRS